MDRRERSATQEEALRAASDALRGSLWTGMPGIIQSFNPAAMTCEVQPAIMGRIRQPDGTIRYVNMPLLVDVPVYFPAGGSVVLTMPVAPGDECFVAFADRCIDAWWQQGGIQPPMELRMHDLSDGFAFVGVFSQPRVIENVNDTVAQLRTADGTVALSVDPVNGIARVSAPTVIVHAAEKLYQDCYGYGTLTRYLGGKNYSVTNYGSDASVTTSSQPLLQPDISGGTV
jgi:hypothetical protein